MLIHYVPLGATHTACGKPRGDISPIGASINPDHVTCPDCRESINHPFDESLDEMTRTYLRGTV